MRVDTIDLRIGDHHVRVNVEGPGIDELRSVLAGHVVEEPAEVAFVVRAPSGASALHLVLDRAGFVLARVRSVADCLAIVLEHLGVFLESSPGTTRLRARALIDGEGRAVVATFPLFIDPPVVERRLDTMGYRILDRVAVDVDDEARIIMTPSPWSGFEATDLTGHCAATLGTSPIEGLLTPAASSASQSRAGSVVTLVHSMAPTTDLSRRIALAEKLSALPTASVPLSDRQARYDALREVAERMGGRAANR